MLGVSGGPDSVYLATRWSKGDPSLVLGHVNHGARGKESDKDQKFVEKLGRDLALPVEVLKTSFPKGAQIYPKGFEEKARKARHSFLRGLKEKYHAEDILLAHTADDQVETILMRVFDGAGISGLKGIPRKTREGIDRPLLDTWRDEIMDRLHREGIAYRIDRSNFDTRFERNWIRHVLLPILEKRYGPSVKKRIHALGARFREIDRFLEDVARKWIRRNIGVLDVSTAAILFPRFSYARLPAAARKKILQLVCFEKIGISPNERLLESMDALAVSGKGPSAGLDIGRGAVMRIRYGDLVLTCGESARSSPAKETGRRIPDTIPGFRMDGPGRYPVGDRLPKACGSLSGIPWSFLWAEKEPVSPAVLRRQTRGERKSFFDADAVPKPLFVRSLRHGDRIQPFGLDREKKVKEILIERKIPREERWGRPVVCDCEGRILWIPGVLRSSLYPVANSTRRCIVLTAAAPRPRPSRSRIT